MRATDRHAAVDTDFENIHDTPDRNTVFPDQIDILVAASTSPGKIQRMDVRSAIGGTANIVRAVAIGAIGDVFTPADFQVTMPPVRFCFILVTAAARNRSEPFLMRKVLKSLKVGVTTDAVQNRMR